MKIEVIDKNNNIFFINRSYLDEEDLKDKDNVILTVKDFMQVYKNKLHLRGFYKVKVYLNRNIGMFLDIIRLEEVELSNVVDLRVIVNMNDKIYFETDDYFILPSDATIYYYNNKFYCDVSFIDNVLDIVEFGRFLYGDRLLDILDCAKVV